ncbi:MAG: cell envelope integrity protein TolA [Legionellaceae bacterium]|nr:cell envelope integrity protein TolA [Legionellaceae bacterium]
MRVEGFYEDGEILRGKVTQTSTDKLGITEGRYDGSHFIGTCTICDWKTKEQVSFKGRFPRRQDLSTFDVEVTGPHKLSNVTLKKYDISQPEYTPDGRLFYEYVGEIQSGVPHGYGTHKYWNRENTMCFVSSGDFILGRMQTRGKITAYIVSESAGVAPLKVPTTSSTYSTYELDIDAKSKTLASISAMEPGTSLSTTQWTLTRRPNGTMYYQSSTRKGAVKVGIEVDLFSTIEAELMRTEGVKPFAPTQSVPGKESVAVSPELQEMANEEQAKKALKEKQRQDALAKKVIQDKLRQEEQAKKEALKAQKEALRQEAEAQKNLAKKRQLVAEKAQRKKYIAEYEALLAQEEALLVAEDAPARMTVPTREAATQTTQSFVSLQKEALCLDDETPAESINTQKILKALSEGKGEWFYTYTRKDSYGGTHQVKKWIQSRESLKNVPNSNFIMILQDEEESLEEYVTIFLVANTPLLKGAVFTGSAIVNVIEKGSDKIIESFRYYGDFICTENFYSDIGDELNFEFKKGYRTSIDTINDVVVEQEGTFDHDEPRCIKPSKRYASVAAWEQQTGRRVQPEQCAASQNRYGFYSGIKPHKSPVTPTPIGENAVEHQRGIK